MRKLLFVILLFAYLFVSSQNNALILNDAVVVSLNANVVLSINQPKPSGIALAGSALGYIKSESEQNRVAWHINNQIGNYIIPFGVSGSKIDLKYNINTAGDNVGTLVASTYSTNNNNIVYPTSVSNLFLDASGTDKSLFAIDRFWVLKKEGWASLNPQSNLTLTYRDIEFAPANTISENMLLGQYWNTSVWTPAWDSGTPMYGTNDATNNQVNTINAGNGNFYTWLLSSPEQPLPVEILELEANCNQNNTTTISWKTATETNNNYFIIERSSDGNTWDFVTNISGAGNSNKILFYSYNNNINEYEGSYYRLSQTDFDGKFEIIGKTFCKCDNANENDIALMAFKNTDGNLQVAFNSYYEQKCVIQICDVLGRVVCCENIQKLLGQNRFVLTNINKNCFYIIRLISASADVAIKVYY